MTRDEVFDRLRQVLPLARTQFGVRDLSVFGSFARDEARADSDLDVLVDLAGPATFVGFMGLKALLEDTLGVRIDLVTRAAHREAVPMDLYWPPPSSMRPGSSFPPSTSRRSIAAAVVMGSLKIRSHSLKTMLLVMIMCWRS